MNQDRLRAIPSVTTLSDLLQAKGITASVEQATLIARSIQESIRANLIRDSAIPINVEIDRQIAAIESLFERSRFTQVVNATGILVHTNLGRAPVSEETARAMQEAALGAVALEIEPESGRRGGRMREISRLFRLLTGAQAALVVNNNAAAILLTLSALAAGKRVAISRAEAVEIGGGFRIPDVLEQSGATLVEVGTTNRTYASDYAKAVSAGNALVLKVHSSNFAISGFVADPTLHELRDVANESGVLLIEDLGSGTLIDTARSGMDHEPTIQESVEAGVDVVTFSGDKLLGGPQAGIILGKKELVDRIAAAPLARAVRADKTTLAGIATTLRHYLRGDAETSVPIIRMMSWGRQELHRRAEHIATQLEILGCTSGIVETTNYVGGGSLPGQSLPGIALELQHGTVRADDLAKRLRLAQPTAVYGRIERDRLLIEMRTVLPKDDDVLVRAIAGVMSP